MEEHMFKANENFFDSVIRNLKEGGFYVDPVYLGIFKKEMKKLAPVDDRSYEMLKSIVRPEWFSENVLNPHFVEMN